MINKKDLEKEVELLSQFWKDQVGFWAWVVEVVLGWSGVIKNNLSKMMYRQRGRFSQSFVNVGMAGLAFVAMVFSGTIESIIVSADSGEDRENLMVLSVEQASANTQILNANKGDVTEYIVAQGDTVSSIALKFGVTIDTMMWENGLKSVDAIKVGQRLRVLPVTGVKHKVKRGETVYSIAKYYSVDPQNIVDYTFNTFVNDETFALAAGQDLMVPEGVKPREVIIDTARYATKTVAPVPGVVGEGRFMWPTAGRISQRYAFYHRAVDIANASSPDILASQGGTVITAGWNGGGYGNYVVIDHGNGYQTWYGHMITGSLVVKAGEVVSQGQKIGRMGSTGRSTGTHLHFEIRSPNGSIDPLKVLK